MDYTEGDSVDIRLDSESEAVRHLVSSDPHLAQLIERLGPLEYAVRTDYFEFLCETVIGQFLSKKAAVSLCEKFYERYNNPINREKLQMASVDDLRSIGLSRNKAIAINEITEHEADLCLDSMPLVSNQEAISRLTKITGIGPWTAKMFLIFALDRQDILPYEDEAFIQAYLWLYGARSKKPSTVSRRCRTWRPFSSIAARYLYIALDSGLTKDSIR